jgi:hypothetical protein
MVNLNSPVMSALGVNDEHELLLSGHINCGQEKLFDEKPEAKIS